MVDPLKRWHDDWHELGLVGDERQLDHLLAALGAPGRHYHTLQHVTECLDLFDQVRHLAERPAEVALALWFHDAVYVPRARDNEARSAALATEALREAGATPDMITRVKALIMATAHRDVPEGRDATLVVDIDLAILGADRARFAQYEQEVRDEYLDVPTDEYQRKRCELLGSFLARPVIYRTPELRARFEVRARANLATSCLERPRTGHLEP